MTFLSRACARGKTRSVFLDLVIKVLVLALDVDKEVNRERCLVV